MQLSKILWAVGQPGHSPQATPSDHTGTGEEAAQGQNPRGQPQIESSGPGRAHICPHGQGPWSPAATAPNPETASATHAGAAHEHDEEGLQDAGHAHNPRQAQEEDHAEDVLQTGQVDSDEGAHAWVLKRENSGSGEANLSAFPGDPSSGSPSYTLRPQTEVPGTGGQGKEPARAESFSCLDLGKWLRGSTPQNEWKLQEIPEQDPGCLGAGWSSERDQSHIIAREQSREQPAGPPSSVRGMAGWWESLGKDGSRRLQALCITTAALGSRPSGDHNMRRSEGHGG